MSSFIENSLIAGETVQFEAKISWLSQFWGFVLAILLIHTIVMPILLIAVSVARILTTKLVGTNKRILGKTGVIRRNSVDLPLNKVESVTLKQSIMGRIFQYGSVVVHGTGGKTTGLPSSSIRWRFAAS